MGACLCSLDDSKDPGSPLFFHPYVKGCQITMDQSHQIASREATFHDGIVFSNRPIQPFEKVTLKILKEDCKWNGGLRLGFTSEDPSRLEPHELPPFLCPSLVHQGKTWACILPEELEEEGTIISFWVDRCGYVFCSSNHRAEYFLFDGVPVKTTLWAVLDVYGRTKAVQLLESNYKDDHILPEDSEAEECVVCYGSEANATMLPCCHSSFCADCSLKILHSSSCCPLCRRRVDKVICSPAWPQTHSHAEKWLEDTENLLPPR